MTQNTNPVHVHPTNKKLSDAVSEAIKRLGPDAPADLIRATAREIVGPASNNELNAEIINQRGRRLPKRAKLSDVDKYRLMSWLDANRDRVRNTNTTRQAAIDAIKAEAKMSDEGKGRINDNILSVAAKEFGIRFKQLHTNRGNTATVNLWRRIDQITAWCEEVGKQLGVPLPPTEPPERK